MPDTVPPAPMQEEGRRFSVGILLSRGLSVWFSNLPLFLGISLLCHLPLVFFFRGSANAAAARELEKVGGLLQPLITAIVSGAVIRGVFEQLRGGRASFRDSLEAAIGSFWRIVATTFAAALVALFFGLLLIVPGIMMVCSYFVAVPAAVVEGTGLSDSLGRSRKLTEGYRWHVFAFYVVMFLGLIVVSGILGEVLFSSKQMSRFLMTKGTIQALISNVVPNAIFDSLTAVFPGVAYYQLRVVKEGIDIEQLAAVFD
jgi:hypothetical protein